ncbi:MAG TPA: hypothetical protein VH599_09955 [Ktedonobacterales bacterium]|jgi:hypothetical protein
MGALSFFNTYRLTGILLIVAGIVFGIGAALPIFGEKGNMGIYTLPVREQLQAIANNPNAWRWGNIFTGTAFVVLLVGMSLLTTILEGSKEQAFSRLGLVGLLLAAGLWVIFSAFRGVVGGLAAQEFAATGAVPNYYEPLAKFAFVLFFTYAAIGFLALASYGGSLLQAGLLPAWVGWATLLFSIAMLVLLLVMGDNLPLFHYLPPLLIGILLLAHG